MIVGILLAAGKGTRFGSQKLLARLPGGDTVVEASARVLQGALTRVVAVTAAENAVAKALRACGCEVVINPRAEEGMGTSIAAGVAAMVATTMEDTEGWLIALGDMPYVLPATMAKLHTTLASEGGIVVPTYQTKRGHPVGFHGRFRAALVGLEGDAGAKKIVAAYHREVNFLAVNDSGVIADIDTPADMRG